MLNFMKQTNSFNYLIALVIAFVGIIIYRFLIKKESSDRLKAVIAIFGLLSLSLLGVTYSEGLELKAEFENEQTFIKYVDENKKKFIVEIPYGETKEGWYDDTYLEPINKKELNFKGDKIGTHKVTVEFKDVDNKTHSVDYYVKVFDNEAPTLKGVKDFTFNFGESVNLDKLGITAEDNVDDKVEIEFKGEIDTKKAGDYPITVVARDRSGNEAKETFTITIKQKPKEKPKATPSSNNTPSKQSSQGSNSKPSSGNSSKPANSGKPSTQSKPKSTPKPESKPQPKPEPKPQPKPKPESKPEPKPEPKPETESSKYTRHNDLARKMHDMVNAERKRAGLNTLRWNDKLVEGTYIRAEEIVDLFSHTRPNGSQWHTVHGSAHGENIARGQRTVERAMEMLMDSPGHKANILRPEFKSAAYAVLSNENGRMHYVQLFSYD